MAADVKRASPATCTTTERPGTKDDEKQARKIERGRREGGKERKKRKGGRKKEIEDCRKLTPDKKMR